MTKRILVMVVGVWAGIGLISCGSGSGAKSPPSGLPNRVLSSQSVSSSFTFGELAFIDGENDSIPRIAPIQAGISPGLMAISPSRNLVGAVDSITNSVYTVDTVTEKSIGHVQLPGPSSSFVIPTSDQVGYAAVPTASVNGFTFLGAVEEMNLTGGIITTFAVTNAQTVVSNSAGSQLLVFPPPETTPSGVNTVTVLTPANATPPVDISCATAPNSVCVVLSGFDRPVNAIVNGNTAYVLNCGPQCGGIQASVAVLDLSTLTVTNTIPVDAATAGYLIGSTLYVAGTSPTNNTCTNQTTAAPTCGRLDTIDLTSNTVTSSIAITDGFHTNIDMSINGQLFIGSHMCSEVGNSNNPVGEVRGCLTILNTNTGSLIFPPQNGDVNGMQSFTTREVEYVAQNGNLYVYNTNNGIDELLIDDFIQFGIVDVVGYVGDVKAIDFF